MNGNKGINFSNAIDQGEGKAFIDSALREGLDINALQRDGRTMLSYACEYGNLGIVKYLVKKDAAGIVKDSDGCIPLHIAAKYGHEDIVKFFHNLGVYVDSCDSNNYTPLHYACENGRSEVAQFLVKNNADVNVKTRQGDTSLLLAMRKKHRDVVEFLIMSGADLMCSDNDKWTVLHFACRNGWLDIVQSLVNETCDVNVKTSCDGYAPLLLAVEFHHTDIVELLIKSGADLECCYENKWRLSYYAAFKGWLEIMQSLMDKKFDTNMRCSNWGITLLLAADFNHRDIVELLIRSGVDVEYCGKDRKTLLHYASKNGWLEIVQYLVSKKFDPNVISSDGSIPLLIAANYYHRDVVEFLIKSGADVECCDEDKKTPLHHASGNGWLEIVQCLVNKKCELNAKTSRGNTPLLIAAQKCHRDVVKLLIKCGADVECCGEFKKTLLHHASVNGWLEIVQSLVNKRCELNAKTSCGFTSLLLAAENCHKDIVELLIESGADVECCTPNKETVWHYASRNGWRETMQSVNTLFILNKFNNRDLPSLYTLPGCVERLPSIEKLKIAHSRNATREIEKWLECEVLRGRPMVLQMLSVKTLIDYYQLKIEKS